MYKLVVIDDEYIVVEGIKAIIQREQMNCEVVGFAYNGVDGLDVIREKQPDIVITDIRIPGLDGLSLVEAAKEFLPDTAFIVISGYTEFEYARRAIRLGVKSYIDKPITIEKVAEAIGAIDKEYKKNREQREKMAKEEVYQQGLRQISDDMIAAILMEEPKEFQLQMEHFEDHLKKYIQEVETFRSEAFRMVCVAEEVFSDQKKKARQERQVSYGKFKELDTIEDVCSYMKELVKTMAEQMKVGKVGSNHRVVNQLLTYIEEHYNEDIGLNELADMVELNPAYLSILFKSEVGMSYVKYLTKIRINKAKEFLENGYRVGEVSEMVGYNNYRYFTDIFKKQMGQTPNEYKGSTRRKE